LKSRVIQFNSGHRNGRSLCGHGSKIQDRVRPRPTAPHATPGTRAPGEAAHSLSLSLLPFDADDDALDAKQQMAGQVRGRLRPEHGVPTAAKLTDTEIAQARNLGVECLPVWLSLTDLYARHGA
jgi:hypothetical protein